MTSNRRTHKLKMTLKKGGKLIRTDSDYNEATEKHVLSEHEVNIPTAYERHDLPLELEDGLTLMDVLLYVNSELDFWDLLLGNWCKDYVKEGLTPYVEKKPEHEDNFELKFLEIYQIMEINIWKDGGVDLSGAKRLDFHGRGQFTKQPDYIEEGGIGDWMNIGVGFTPMNDLARYEIKIKEDNELWLSDNTKRYNAKGEDQNPKALYKFTELEVSLFDFLWAIFWEMSFHGGPTARDQVMADLNQSMDDIKSGKAKLIPAEEVFKGLEDRLEEMKNEREEEKA